MYLVIWKLVHMVRDGLIQEAQILYKSSFN